MTPWYVVWTGCRYLSRRCVDPTQGREEVCGGEKCEKCFTFCIHTANSATSVSHFSSKKQSLQRKHSRILESGKNHGDLQKVGWGFQQRLYQEVPLVGVWLHSWNVFYPGPREILPFGGQIHHFCPSKNQTTKKVVFTKFLYRFLLFFAEWCSFHVKMITCPINIDKIPYTLIPWLRSSVKNSNSSISAFLRNGNAFKDSGFLRNSSKYGVMPIWKWHQYFYHKRYLYYRLKKGWLSAFLCCTFIFLNDRSKVVTFFAFLLLSELCLTEVSRKYDKYRVTQIKICYFKWLWLLNEAFLTLCW